MDEQSVSIFTEYYVVLKERWLLILSITIMIVAAGAALAFYILPPSYESSTSIIVSNPRNTGDLRMQYDTVIMYQKLMKTYAEIAKSRLVAEKASIILKNEIKGEELKKSFKVIPQSDTQILLIKASGKDPKKVEQICSAITTSFIAEAKRVLPVGEINIMDAARIPDAPSKPNKMLILAIAFLFGLLFSSGMAFAIASADTTIKNEYDIGKYIGLPVLVSIPVE